MATGTTKGRSGWDDYRKRQQVRAANMPQPGDVTIKMPGAFPYRDIGGEYHCALPDCGERILAGETAVWWRKPEAMAHAQCVARDWDRRRNAGQPTGVHYQTTPAGYSQEERRARRARLAE